MKPVTLNISFEDLLGKGPQEMDAETRRARWEQWKKLAKEAAQWWWPEGCHGCKHLEGDWCTLMQLPASVNPILSYHHAMPGMACMGVGGKSR